MNWQRENRVFTLLVVIGLVTSCGRERVKLPPPQPKNQVTKPQTSPAPQPDTQPEKTYGPPGEIPNIANFVSLSVLPLYLIPNNHQCDFDLVAPLVAHTSPQMNANIEKAKVRNELIKNLFPQWAGFAEAALGRLAAAYGWDPPNNARVSAGAFVAFGKKDASGKIINPTGYKPEVNGADIPAGIVPQVECASVYMPK